jgi:aspartokinase
MSITSKVWKYIDNDSSIKNSLSRDLINTRALAKTIIKDLGINTGVETVVSAIRRYDTWENQTNHIYKNSRNLLKNSTFSSKSNIVCLTLNKNKNIQIFLSKLISLIEVSKGEILRIVHSELSILIVIDEKNLEKVVKDIPKTDILEIRDKLVEINILFDKDGPKTPGIVSVVSTELSSNNINIEEIMTTVPELVILIKETDFIKATHILYDLIRNV